MDDNREQPIGSITQPKDQLEGKLDPLSISLDDDELIERVDRRIEASQKFYKDKYNLEERRKKNEKYLFGRQIQDKEKNNDLKDYNSRFLDNTIYDAESNLKALSLSKTPDFSVLPASQNPDSEAVAEKLSDTLNDEMSSMERRRVLGLAFKHLPAYFVGIIKPRWDPEIGEDGDYVFEVVLPENVIFDHTCPTNDASKMGFIAQYVPTTPQKVMMQFPGKKEKFLEALQSDGIVRDGSNLTSKEMASDIKICEVWFTEYKQAEDKWEKVEGVLWKYKKVLLGKMKDPNWDWQGERRLFAYDDMENKQGERELTEDEMRQSMYGMPIEGMFEKEIYHNYFDSPQKPFILLGYDQWGKMPLDETSRIEQAVPLQEDADKRGQQISEMIDRARGKHVWSKDGGLKAEDIEEMDLSDPEQDVLVDGDITKVHQFIPAEQPSAQMFKDKSDMQYRIMQKMGVQAVSGEIQTDVATTSQIAREANFTKDDDLVMETINYAAQKMAEWAMQFMKLRYTKDHFRRIVGRDGSWVHMQLSRDMIEDGMIVKIKASSVDKLRAERNAKDMAQLKMIDPLSYYEDVGASDPKGRAEKLITFMSAPDLYLAKYVKRMSTEEMATTLNGQPPMVGEQMPPLEQPPLAPSPTNTSVVPELAGGAPMGSPRNL